MIIKACKKWKKKCKKLNSNKKNVRNQKKKSKKEKEKIRIWHKFKQNIFTPFSDGIFIYILLIFILYTCPYIYIYINIFINDAQRWADSTLKIEGFWDCANKKNLKNLISTTYINKLYLFFYNTVLRTLKLNLLNLEQHCYG